ncbi:MAG: bifunctional adenosylcobinamide kinase/adenosylcobinamide-phosphate guanylyltransferase [wastewater metagenome]|nr:bifunctional adenosylcobinamide kinase/adenosylcobinamide-phosphate guanylyltransferase [Candidatus Loosdrechtia aerotolerans]
MAKITFILGGARSGKSAFAEGLARKYRDVIYIATAEMKDDEMRERIRVHRTRRPFNWKTIESPYHIHKTVSEINEHADVIFVDCITLYITNMLFSDEKITKAFLEKDDKREITTLSPSLGGGLSAANGLKLNTDYLRQKQEHILVEINKLSRACRKSKSDIILVSNEVGLGIVPDNVLSRLFRDVAGRANQILADEADDVYFIIAGISQKIK